jgi:ATP-dependent protease ClpP protease subunit
MQRKTNRKRLPLQASLQSDGTLELLIYEDIGADFWTGGGITAKSMKDQIDFAGDFSRLSVRINSPGGDAFEGNAIYNLLRAQKKPIDVYVDGIAASSASIIAMAGDTITMGPNAMMMIHNAWGQCSGYAEDMRKTGDVLDKVSDSIGKVYVGRTGKSADEIASMMDDETWMDARECLDQGFCTEITGDEEIQEMALARARRFKALRRMKHVPEALATATCACDCENCEDGRCSDCDDLECDFAGCEDCPMQASAASARIEPVSIEAARAALEEMEAVASGDAVSLDEARDHIEAIETMGRQPLY